MKSLLARSLPSNPVKARRGVKIILSPQIDATIPKLNTKPKTGLEGVKGGILTANAKNTSSLLKYVHNFPVRLFV